MKLPQDESEGEPNSASPPPLIVENNGNRHNIGAQNDEVPVSHLDSVTRSALDAVFRTTTQTYEDFLGSFSYLTESDVSPPSDQSNNLEDSNSLILAPLPDTPAWTPMSELSCTNPTGEEELEEEILTENNFLSSNPSQDSIPGRKLKLDNFVEHEGNRGSDDEDLQCDLQSLGLDTEGYKASFLGESRSTHTNNNQDAAGSSHFTRSPSPKHNGIETPDNKDIKEATELNDGHDPKCGTIPTHDDDDGDFIVNEPSQKLETQLPDSNEELIYDPKQDLPNLGEICNDHSEPDIKKYVNNRQMEYSAKMGDPQKLLKSVMEVAESQLAETTVIDEVVPFVLDEDFDYDNVVLTPKFTEEEMSYLRSFQKQGT